ncbi:hypothetical protein AB0O14_10020 [Microbacterium foliorum]
MVSLSRRASFAVRSSHILAPYWSSFAQLGWVMGRTAMTYEDSKTGRAPV